MSLVVMQENLQLKNISYSLKLDAITDFRTIISIESKLLEKNKICTLKRGCRGKFYDNIEIEGIHFANSMLNKSIDSEHYKIEKNADFSIWKVLVFAVEIRETAIVILNLILKMQLHERKLWFYLW